MPPEPRGAPSADLLIRDALVVDPRPGGPAVLPAHDVAVAAGRIAAVAPSGTLPGGAADTLDADGAMLLPGFVNTHAHAAMTLFRGAVEDVGADAWFNDHVWRMETNLTPDDVYWGARLAALEMVEAGVTTVADHYFLADEVARAFADAGTRAHLAPTLFGREPERELDDARAFVARWHGAEGGRLRAWIGPHSPYLCAPDFLAACAEMADDLGVGVHLHVSETARQVGASLEAHGLTPPAWLDRLGLFAVPVLAAHAAHATPDDMRLLAERGAGVAHCPKTFLKMALGVVSLVEMRRAGVRVGLGSDGAASNNTLDMLEQARLAALVQKHLHGDAETLPVPEAITLLWGGAEVLGQGDELGRVAPGHLADLVLVRLDGAHVRPLHDPLAALLYSVRAADVDTTIVGGRVLYRGGRHVVADAGEVLREADARAPRLVARGEAKVSDYPD